MSQFISGAPPICNVANVLINLICFQLTFWIEAAEAYGMTWTWIHYGMGPALLTSPWVIATLYILSTFFIILLRKKKLVPFINEVCQFQWTRHYWVSHLLMDWVGLTWILIVPLSAQFWLGRWEFGRSSWADQSQPNPEPRADETPCIQGAHMFQVSTMWEEKFKQDNRYCVNKVSWHFILYQILKFPNRFSILSALSADWDGRLFAVRVHASHRAHSFPLEEPREGCLPI